MRNSMNVRTDADAEHWPRFRQLGSVVEGSCVIVPGTVGVAPSLSAGSSASGTLETNSEAGTI